MRLAAEKVIDQPLEMIISNGDFVVSSQYEGDQICKFKADQYHIMAWRTPADYPVGVEMFADNGHTNFVGCKGNTTVLEGSPSLPLHKEFRPFRSYLL